MLASYLLSRTLIPTWLSIFLKPCWRRLACAEQDPFVVFQGWFERGLRGFGLPIADYSKLVSVTAVVLQAHSHRVRTSFRLTRGWDKISSHP